MCFSLISLPLLMLIIKGFIIKISPDSRKRKKTREDAKTRKERNDYKFELVIYDAVNAAFNPKKTSPAVTVGG